MVAHLGRVWKGKPVETYARSMIRVLRERGHTVIEADKRPHANYSDVDMLLDIDCGRNEKGELLWHGEDRVPNTLSAVYLIDSHGNPVQHHRIAKNYDHVFYAVYAKRDLFTGHSSAHWTPNFTDRQWFDGAKYEHVTPSIDFGFFGSKGGLDRANPMKAIAQKNNWSIDVRQVNYQERHRWPFTAEEMAKCRVLLNKAQKHDGPNLRVMESMAMLRPLVTDHDSLDGMSKLFKPYEHYIPYGDFDVVTRTYSHHGLEEAMALALQPESQKIAENGYKKVMANHLVENRIEQIL
ncbi:MAG: glycosyltransferase, partial [Nitrososphaera sp.]|nr:glycosyltransferase [Nitrososphaera sp.]